MERKRGERGDLVQQERRDVSAASGQIVVGHELDCRHQQFA
ncbi:hypothetical protein [Streptomyces sp. NPDC087437]